MSNNSHTQEISLNQDQRYLLEYYKNLYDQTYQQIDLLYLSLDNIKSNIDSIAGLSQISNQMQRRRRRRLRRHPERNHLDNVILEQSTNNGNGIRTTHNNASTNGINRTTSRNTESSGILHSAIPDSARRPPSHAAQSDSDSSPNSRFFNRNGMYDFAYNLVIHAIIVCVITPECLMEHCLVFIAFRILAILVPRVFDAPFD